MTGVTAIAEWLANRRAELGGEAARMANFRIVLRDHTPSTDAAAAWDQQARDLYKLAARCGWRPTLNGAPPDD